MQLPTSPIAKSTNTALVIDANRGALVPAGQGALINLEAAGSGSGFFFGGSQVFHACIASISCWITAYTSCCSCIIHYAASLHIPHAGSQITAAQANYFFNEVKNKQDMETNKNKAEALDNMQRELKLLREKHELEMQVKRDLMVSFYYNLLQSIRIY